MLEEEDQTSALKVKLMPVTFSYSFDYLANWYKVGRDYLSVVVE